ncbi:MAG: hypothetical protein P1R58_02270, partial [bacterium]|nr:hypothetical protein [bacterium]
MKYLNAKSLLIVLILVMAFALTSTARTPNVRFNDIRALGMGGPGITTMSDMSAMMYNPAMLARAEFGIDLINIQGRVSRDVINLIDFVDENQKVFDEFSEPTTT